MIEVRNLTFEYPGKRALDSVSFSVPPASITALVGPNGAGKTTLLRCMAALQEPLSGEIMIDGINVQEQPRACHQRLGFLPDFFGLYDQLSVRQCLAYAARAKGIEAARLDERVREAARGLEIEDRLESKAGDLSRGLRQRLAIAQAIIHQPSVLLLDEPASGLDPDARYSLSKLMLTLRDQGMTLIVSSHILSELEEYSSRMIVIRDGHLTDHDGLDEASGQQTHLLLRLAEPLDEVPALLDDLPDVTFERMEAGRLYITLDSGDRDDQAIGQQRHQLLRSLLDGGVAVCGLEQVETRLQDVYQRQLADADIKGPAADRPAAAQAGAQQ